MSRIPLKPSRRFWRCCLFCLYLLGPWTIILFFMALLGGGRHGRGRGLAFDLHGGTDGLLEMYQYHCHVIAPLPSDCWRSQAAVEDSLTHLRQLVFLWCMDQYEKAILWHTYQITMSRSFRSLKTDREEGRCHPMTSDNLSEMTHIGRRMENRSLRSLLRFFPSTPSPHFFLPYDHQPLISLTNI